MVTSRSLVGWKWGTSHREGWEGEITKRHEEIGGHEAYVHYLDCGHSFTGVYVCQNLPNCTFHMGFIVCQLYLNKAVKTYSHKMIFR